MLVANHTRGCNTKSKSPTVHAAHSAREEDNPFAPAHDPIEDARVARLPFKVLNSTALQINNLACTLGLEPSLIIEMAIDQLSDVTSGEMKLVGPSINEGADV